MRQIESPKELYYLDKDGVSLRITPLSISKDGRLYYHRKTKSGKASTSISYLLDNENDINIYILKTLFSRLDDLSNYVNRIQNKNSEEFKELKAGMSRTEEPPALYNISSYEMVISILKFLYNDILKEIISEDKKL